MKGVRRLYLLHEKGATRHYDGLKLYCEQNGVTLVFHEFSPIWQFMSGLKHRRIRTIAASISNCFFLFKLLFISGKSIIVGIAPYDWRIIFINLIGRKNLLYYHTSWPNWDGTFFPNKSFLKINKIRSLVLNQWDIFLRDRCKAIFCVTQTALDNLLNNYDVRCQTQVVYHSFDPRQFFPSASGLNSPIRVLFVGRLEQVKGIELVLELAREFEHLPISFGIVGDGSLKAKVCNQEKVHSNIKYYGQVENRQLGAILQEYDFLLLPSMKSKTWEELFGISIIEAMACGVIPITTRHIGPNEIVENERSGFLCDEGQLPKEVRNVLIRITKMDISEILKMKEYSIASSVRYTTENIAKRWAIIDLSRV